MLQSLHTSSYRPVLYICIYLTASLSVPTTSIPVDQPSNLRIQSDHTHRHAITKRQASHCIQRCPYPENVTKESPCGTCNHTECKFEGCVYYSFMAYWKPDPCKTCICNGDSKRCYAESCQEPECYGYPVVRRPWQCCKECDFGIAKNECGLVPKSHKQVSYRYDYLQTCRRLVQMDCYRPYVFENGAAYKCEAEEQRIRVSVNQGCQHIVGKYYKTNGRCVKRLITDDRERPQDYDDDPHCFPIPPE